MKCGDLLSSLRFEQRLERVDAAACVCAWRHRLERGITGDLEGLGGLDGVRLCCGLMSAAVEGEVCGAYGPVAVLAAYNADGSLGWGESEERRTGILRKDLLADVHDRVDAAGDAENSRLLVRAGI
jgi:hypothetical protein